MITDQLDVCSLSESTMEGQEILQEPDPDQSFEDLHQILRQTTLRNTQAPQENEVMCTQIT